MPSAEIQFQTKWWVLNTPEDFFQALKEIRQDFGWNGGVDVWTGSDNEESWQLRLSPNTPNPEPKNASQGNVVMSVAGGIQVFSSEEEWIATYPALAGA